MSQALGHACPRPLSGLILAGRGWRLNSSRSAPSCCLARCSTPISSGSASAWPNAAICSPGNSPCRTAARRYVGRCRPRWAAPGLSSPPAASARPPTTSRAGCLPTFWPGRLATTSRSSRRSRRSSSGATDLCRSLCWCRHRCRRVRWCSRTDTAPRPAWPSRCRPTRSGSVANRRG